MATLNVPKKLKATIEDVFLKTPQWKAILSALPGSKIEDISVTDLTYDLLSIDYDNLDSKKLGVPRDLIRAEYTNDSDTEDLQEFGDQGVWKDSFKWNFKEGIELGVKAKFKVEIPLVGSTEVQTSVGLSFEAGQEWSQEFSRSQSVKTVIRVPAYSKTTAVLTLYETPFSTSYRARIQVTGGHVSVKISWTVGGRKMIQKIDLWGTQWLSLLTPAQRIFETRGTFTGARGLYTEVAKKSVPLEIPKSEAPGPDAMLKTLKAAPAA